MSSKDKSPLFPLPRRRFLQGMAAGATAAVLAPELGQAQFQIEEEISGRPRLPIKLRVNGRTFRLSVEPRWTLLDVLRNQLDLTGTKRVCDRGECGACTALRGARPMSHNAYKVPLAKNLVRRAILQAAGLES